MAEDSLHSDSFPHEKELGGSIAVDNGNHRIPAERVSFTEEEARKVIRKIDFNLLPLCFVLYTFSVLDRSNLGNAKLAGLSKDIDISGNRYTWLGNAFYIAYVLFQFTTIGWKLFKPHRWVTFVVLFWGVVSTLQAACSSWAGLMTCRVFLGWAETMFGPGIPLYFSFFYPREYIGLRFGIFLSGSALANAYGGTLAYGLSHIHSSVSDWRFLFIIEGVPTALLAAVCWFCFPDSPSTARFLNAREKQVAQAIADKQPGDFAHRGLQMNQLFDAFKDYRNYFFAVLNFSCNVSFAALPLFIPTIISQMGSFSQLQSNGLSAPPYLLCFLTMIPSSFLSDHFRLRGPFASFFAFLSAIGYILLGTSTGVAPRYIGIFLSVNIFTTVSVILVWIANTNATESKRAGGIWIMMTIGQCGTLLGTNMFPEQDAPYYRKGSWIGCAFSLTAAVGSATLSFLLWKENRRRDRLYGRAETVGKKVDLATNRSERQELPEEKVVEAFRYMI